MYSFGQPIFAPLPTGVTLPSRKPVMLVIVRVVCGVSLCFVGIKLGIYNVYI